MAAQAQGATREYSLPFLSLPADCYRSTLNMDVSDEQASLAGERILEIVEGAMNDALSTLGEFGSPKNLDSWMTNEEAHTLHTNLTTRGVSKGPVPAKLIPTRMEDRAKIFLSRNRPAFDQQQMPRWIALEDHQKIACLAFWSHRCGTVELTYLGLSTLMFSGNVDETT